MCREWLTGIIKDVYVASRGKYGYRRVQAELTQAHGSPRERKSCQPVDA